MIDFKASDFIHVLRSFSVVEMAVDQKLDGTDQAIDAVTAERIANNLDRLEKGCIDLGAEITAEFVRDTKDDLLRDAKWQNLAVATRQIYQVLKKEIARARTFSISPLKSSFFDRVNEKFELQVYQAFPSTSDDIDEAGKCFALGRHTACVYHLMRVLERPIMVLARELLPNDLGGPNWETVLKKIDAELAKKPIERIFQGDVQFFAEVAAEMRAVKHAWRNRVMHVDTIVTEERAKAIFDATIAFMNVVSNKMSENGIEDPELDLQTASQAS